MYLSNFISSRHYNIKSSLSIKIAQNGEFCPNSAKPTAMRAARSRVGRATEMPPKEGLTLWLRIKASAKKGSASRQIGCRLYITVETIR